MLLAVLNVAIIRLAVERGAVDASAAQVTAVMVVYLLSEAPYMLSQVLSGVLFAPGEAR